jgi:4-amino-4-deoxy-L-arabinose transferase-like glycosyltransferase
VKRLTNTQLVLALAIFAIAALLRMWWNDVAEYSPADEAVYSDATHQFMNEGFFRAYPEVTASFIRDPRMAIYPSPLRYGYLALTTLSAHVAGNADPHTLASLSTFAGILVVPLVFFLALRLFGARTALLAGAFVAVSCIEIAMGRRALQDEVVCLVVFLALALVLLMLDVTPSVSEGSGRAGGAMFLTLAATAALTLAFTVKESFLLLYPALIALVFVYGKPKLRHVIVFGAPPLLYYLGFCALAHDFTSFFRLGRMITSAIAAPYVAQYQAGPPHRPLIDLFITAPLVSLLAVAALPLVTEKRERALVLFIVLALAVFGVLPSKNLRFTIVVDPVVRLLAAWLVVSRGASNRVIAAFAAANAAIELELFQTIFAKGAVYDPVTQALLQAVGAVPHAGAAATGPMLFPWICAAILGVTWLLSKDPKRV